jgi:hypothetical protein
MFVLRFPRPLIKLLSQKARTFGTVTNIHPSLIFASAPFVLYSKGRLLASTRSMPSKYYNVGP